MLWAAQAVTAAFVGLCLALVAGFLVLVCVPVMHVPVRAWLRPLAIHHVESGLDVVHAAQRWQSRRLTTLFTWSSNSVSVTFYASFLPLFFWLGLPELGRNLVFLMALALYVGNAIKDLVCSPRPLGVRYGAQRVRFLGGSDEEARLNAAEYGLPSSHTLNTLCLNYAIVWYLHDRGLVGTAAAGALYVGVALWVCWIAASRLYLGLHTPIDILAGAVAGLAVLVCFTAIEGALTRWVLAGPQAVAHAALAMLLLLRLHPRPAEHTPSYEFTTSFAGSAFGIVVGVAAVSPHAHQPAIQLAALWSRPGRLLWAARRLAVGFVVVAAMKEAARAALLAALPQLYRFFPLRVRRLWQPPVHNLAAPPKGPGGAAANGQAQRDAKAQRHDAQPGGARRRHQRRSDPMAAPQRPPPAGEALPPRDPRLAELPHNAAGVPWDVDVTSRFFAYAAIGVAVAGVTPRILDALGW